VSETPYQNLNPSLILDAIESVGYRCNGSLFPLNSYENRVYQIGIEDADPLIAKFYRPGRWSDEAILEEHQFSLELLSHEIPVVAPLVSNNDQTLHSFADFRFAIFPRKGGRALELDDNEQLEWMGRFIGRLHAVGAVRPFLHRITLDPQTYGYKPYQFLLDQNFIPFETLSVYQETVANILTRIDAIFASAGKVPQIRLHGDCHASNVLWSPTGPHIVDLDDCLMGPAIQDIWMLLSGANPQETKAQLALILKGYRKFHDFKIAEAKLIEALRTLRMIHYTGWLAKRWQDPTFPLNFPWFNTDQYWREQLQNLRQQMFVLES
jgi:Ser/Thr protein kinase RdoA (MazF antagonist)